MMGVAVVAHLVRLFAATNSAFKEMGVSEPLI